MAFSIEVDADLCQGHGVCESEAPAVFEVGRDNKVVVLAESPEDNQRVEVDLAVKYCPTHALSLAGAEPAPGGTD